MVPTQSLFTLLLALPYVLSAPSAQLPQPHVPRAPAAQPPHAARAIPTAHKAHVRPARDLQGPHIGSGKMLVRRRKRACAPQSPVLVDTFSSTSAPPSASSAVGAEETVSTTAIGNNQLAKASSKSSTGAASTPTVQASSTEDSVATASSTSTSAAAAASSSSASSSSSSGLSGILASLFPVNVASRWTTNSADSAAMGITDALKPLTAGKLPSLSNAPDGQSALVANYPAGTFKYSSSTGHGFSFYSPGNHDGVVVDGAQEVIFSYSIYFQDGFGFNKGGKLPGLYGGTSLDAAKSCSGGRQSDREDCFSARMMWRTNGAGEAYNYLPTQDQFDGYCSVAPYSECNPDYGDSIGRGSFTFPTGQWTTIAQRVKLNDVGQKNGEQEIFINGQSVLKLSGMTFAVKEGTKIYGIMAQTFFGGSDSSWASPQDQSAWYKDWSLAVVA